MAKIKLNLNNVDNNGIDDSNILTLSIDMLDIKKIPIDDLLKAKALTLNHIPHQFIEQFYIELRSFKFKIKSLVPALIDFKFDKLCSLLLLFKTISIDMLMEIHDNDIINDNQISIEICPFNKKIIVESDLI
jgi:hypothetical protein